MRKKTIIKVSQNLIQRKHHSVMITETFFAMYENRMQRTVSTTMFRKERIIISLRLIAIADLSLNVCTTTCDLWLCYILLFVGIDL